MNHTDNNGTGRPYQGTVTLTETSTMRDLYQLLETQDLPEHITIVSYDRSGSACIDREEIRQFIEPYTLFIDDTVRSAFLARLGQVSLSSFVREMDLLPHEQNIDLDVTTTPIASSF